jgi:hypothetical protein
MEAASCIQCAGGYVVGVDNGAMRSLTPEEQSEFQWTVPSHSTDNPAVEATPAPAEAAVSDPGYAVMTRIKVGDSWTWTTWIRFETYAEAAAHAREGNKVVRFRSPKWAALRRQTEAASPIVINASRESVPPQGEGETFLEFVLRCLSAYGFDHHAEPISDVKHDSVDPAAPIPIGFQKDGSLTAESDSRTSMSETPTYIARLILSRLTESEIGKLERMCDDDIPALLKALRNQSQTVVKENSGCH